MISLPLELKILIANNDEEVWFRMWMYDEDFRNRTHTESFRKTFVNAFSTLKIDRDKTQTWWLLRKLHRENDQPAKIYPDGSRQWRYNGKLHRENDLPALVFANGYQSWWKDGNRHRGNGLPAVVSPTGQQEWWENGKRHRDNDLPAIIYRNEGGHPHSLIQDEWWENGRLTGRGQQWRQKPLRKRQTCHGQRPFLGRSSAPLNL